MNKENMTAEEIEKFNAEVEYNESAASWVTDIVCAAIAWPMIIPTIRRRVKYSKRIETQSAAANV